MIMLKSVPSRFLAFLLCLLLCVSLAAAEDVSASLTPDTDTWKAGEVFTFSGEVRHPGTDLSYAGLIMEIRTEPDAEDKGPVVITSVNGVEEDPDWWYSETWLKEDAANGDLLRFSGQWTVPEGAQFNKATLTLSVIQDDAVVATTACEVENANPVINLHGLTVWQLAAILLAIIAVVSGIWFLLHRKKDNPDDLSDNQIGGRVLDTVIVVLVFFGLIVTPTMVRMPFLKKAFPSIGYFWYFCFPGALALLLSFLRLKQWKKTDLLFFAAWLLLQIPMCVSNRDLEYKQYVVIICQNLLPVFFVFYRLDQKTRQKTIRLFLIMFNVSVILMLVLAFEERMTNKAAVRALHEWLVSQNMYSDGFGRFIDDSRFFSFWGHPLTNALLFNSLLILNTAWYKSKGKTIYALMYYPVAMAGVLLSGSKTGITVCLIMLFIICWDHKKWLLLCIPAFVALYFTGAFNTIIYRFTHTSLTTGRVEALVEYVANQYSAYPLQWLTGYSSSAVLYASHPLYPLRPAFEFPLLMSAFDYGILFSVVFHVGFFGYFTWRCLRKKQWTIWLSFTLLYAEVHTYNAFVLRNNDVMFLVYFLAMLILNIAEMDRKPLGGLKNE